MNNLQHKYNPDLAWDKLHSKLKEDNLLESNHLDGIKFKQLMKIAAFFLLAITITFLSYNYINGNKTDKLVLVETSFKDEIKKVHLPDGSFVYLNLGSKLYYPKEFDAEKRLVKFEGEAFFDIAKNPNKAFVIQTNKADITVLGTSFNINTQLENKNVEVFVKTGKVQVLNLKNNNENVFLNPGELALVKSGVTIKSKNHNQNYLSWKTKVFNFHGVAMYQVINDLSKAYKTKIILENTSCQNSIPDTDFENKSLDAILDILSELYNLEVRKEEGVYILK